MYENLEPQDMPIDGWCLSCGGEIYSGEVRLRTDEGMIHRDKQCLLGYIAENFSTSELISCLTLKEVIA